MAGNSGDQETGWGSQIRLDMFSIHTSMVKDHRNERRKQG